MKMFYRPLSYQALIYLSLAIMIPPLQAMADTNYPQDKTHYSALSTETDTDLLNIFNKFPNLKSLNLVSNWKVTDTALSKFTNLESLNFGSSQSITGASLNSLTNLETLILGWNNKGITDAVFSNLTKLTSLDLGWGNNNLTNDGLTKLINLRDLKLGSNQGISDGLHQLPHLTRLNGKPFQEQPYLQRSTPCF